MANVCVISARGGSKGVLKKNIRPLLGKPLIAWTIEQALGCPEIDYVVVSTDCEDIARVAIAHGAQVPFMRPAELAKDSSGKWDVWQHALKACETYFGEKFDIFIDLDCTSPLRDIDDITKCINLYKNSNVDAVFSVCDARKNPYFNMLEYHADSLRICKELANPIVRRQDAPRVLEHVASIYVLSPDYVKRGTGLLSGKTKGYNIGVEKSLDIDSEFDFDLIEFLMKKRFKTVG